MAGRRPKRPRDPNQLAKMIADLSTGETAETPAPVSARRAGGLKGGKARAEKLTQEERQEIASTAARARWKK